MLFSPKMKIGISWGSLEVLKKGIKREDSPETLYLLTSGKCQNNCAFCTQARESKSNDLYLSRVIWPPIEIEELISLLKKSGYLFKRICIQSTKTGLWKDIIKELISRISILSLPISLSIPVESLEEVNEFLDLGVDKINISLDVADPSLFEKIKEKSFKEKIELIKNAGEKHKGKITSHIIIGLGENEKDVIKIIEEFIKKDITIALFAFTPLPGTKLENMKAPSYVKYRKIQIITYLLKKKLINYEDLNFDKDDNLIIENWWIKKAEPFFKEIFLTSGCPNCNRPYYNESPKIFPYNFPRPIKEEEIEEILNLLTTENVLKY